MRTVFGKLGCTAGVVLSLIMVSTADGQAPRSGVHRMEVNNGTTQTVRYYAIGLSPGESASLRDLERAENETSYLGNLQNLKRQYVADERRLEATRALAQQELYGRFMSAGGSGAFGYLGLDPNYLAAWNMTGYYGLPGYYGLGAYATGVYAPVGYGSGLLGAGLLGNSALNASLAYGIGSDNPIKDSMASVIAQQATMQYAASVDRDLDRAIAQVGASPTMRVALGLPDATRRSDSYIRPVAADAEPTDPVVVALKDGTVIRGTKMEETKEWVTVTTSKGRRVRVRLADVTRIDEGKRGVGPAAGD